MFRSNSKYYVKSTISASQTAGSTFTISPDFELGLNLETGTDNVSIVLQSNTQIERMTITATGGVATIVQRWLDQSATKTPEVWLQKQWNDGTIMYIAALAPDMLDIDMSSGSAEISTPTVYTNSLSATQDFQWPVFADTTARDAAITAPENWFECFITGTGKQIYSGGAWTTLWVGSPTPFASTTVAGSVEIATQTEVNNGTSTGGTGAILSVSPDTLQVALANAIAASNPIGHVRIWTTGTAPTWYLMCDGTAVSRTTFAGLFAVIWTLYGSWDGSTTFNIPNLKWKVVVGFDNTQSEFNSIGLTGWEKTHTLTTWEMPSHSHNILSNSTAWGGSSGKFAGTTYNNTSTTWTTETAWSGGAHNNLQPYITLNYIIKT